MGGGTPPAPPAQPQRRSGARLYDALAAALEPLHVGQQMEIGEALTTGREWSALEPWMRELFNAAAERLR